MEKTIPTIEEQLQRFQDFCKQVMDRGMERMAGAQWPVIVRRWGNGGREEREESPYVYQYPETYFRNLKSVNRLYLYGKTKADRGKVLKALVDSFMAGEIDVYLYHFGIYMLYSRPYAREEDIEAIGKRRAEFMQRLPRFELKSNDEYLSEVWWSLIERRWPEVGEEIVRVPSFKDVRILFTPDQFGAYTGRHYSDADWLEPVPDIRLEVKKWVGEKDPMTPEPKKKGMIEGPITLGHQGANNLRHFVAGEPVHAGSYIEVKFGDGWIPGRYEWSFQQGSPIQVHSSRHECLYIGEGHLVRIRS